MPWRHIVTSGPVWAIVVANFSAFYGLNTYVVTIPTFFFDVLFFDIKTVIINKFS